MQPALAKVIGEDVFSDNVIWVREHSAALSDIERYDYLADWVLPSETHSGIRLCGGFLRTDAAPDNGPLRIGSIANFVSPVFDLLDVARKLDRLPALSERLSATPETSTSEQQRARLALQLLLTAEMQGNPDDIERDASALSQLLQVATLSHLNDVWPETLVVVRGMQQQNLSPEVIGDLITLIKNRGNASAVPLGSGFEAWHDLIFALGRQNFIHQSRPQQTLNELDADTHLSQWRSIPRQRGFSRGSGFPRSMWMWDGTQIEHLSGHEEDYLFYQCPLEGDFAIDFDIPSDSQTQIYAGGHLLGPNWGAQLCFGDMRSGAGVIPLTPPLNHLENWAHGRIEFHGESRSLFINGRSVRTDQLAGPRYPWLASHSWARNEGRLRDVRITGSPIIPDSIPLSADTELTGWHSYQEAAVGLPGSSWTHQPASDDTNPTGEIIGLHQPWLAGSHCERLLVYQRPLLEDGAIEYDFYYEPGRVMAFPALDRMAFLFDLVQVSIHQITDDKFDRRDLPPENAKPVHQGEKSLPLRANAWNRMRLAVVDRTVSLMLNGERILEGELEPTNTRQFGFFHFADQTEVRVRNVVMSGQWPKVLPSLEQQELANSNVQKTEAEISKLKTVFHHHFSAGLPEKYFSIPPGDREGNIELMPEGLKCVQKSPGPVSKSFVRPHFEVRGNFDVSIHFKDWQSSNHDFCGASLEMVAQSGHRFAVTRRVQNKDYHWAVLEWGIPKGNGELTSYYQTVTTEATEGHLRVVRLGDVWHALFADNNTSVYRVIATVPLEGTESSPVTFQMAAVAGASGRTEFNWEGIRVAAEELMLLPDASQAPKVSLATMKVDGTELKRLSQPDADDPGHGSPDWSPDGKQIVFDSWRGSAAASQIFMVNADGTNLRLIGTGSMPTFSPDGKQLAFSGQDGMSIMKSDGTDRRVISKSGWGAQWSSQGDGISYGSYQSVNNVSGGNIAITDIPTKKTRYVLQGEHATRYSQIYWNMEWSPDSQQICFKGRLPDGGAELAITNVAGSSQGFQVLTNQLVDTDISWHPDGKSILVSMPSPQHAGAYRLFVYELTTKTFKYLESQPAHPRNTSAAWSPDGTRIAFITLFPVEPIPWNEANEN